MTRDGAGSSLNRLQFASGMKAGSLRWSPTRRRPAAGAILAAGLVAIVLVVVGIVLPVLSRLTHTNTYHVNAVLPAAPAKGRYPYGVQTRSGMIWYFEHPTGLVPGDVLLVRYNGLGRQLGTTIHGVYTPTSPQPNSTAALITGLILVAVGAVILRWCTVSSLIPAWARSNERAIREDNTAGVLQVAGRYRRAKVSRRVKRHAAVDPYAGFRIQVLTRRIGLAADRVAKEWFVGPVGSYAEFCRFEKDMKASGSRELAVSYRPSTRIVTSLRSPSGPAVRFDDRPSTLTTLSTNDSPSSTAPETADDGEWTTAPLGTTADSAVDSPRRRPPPLVAVGAFAALIFFQGFAASHNYVTGLVTMLVVVGGFWWFLSRRQHRTEAAIDAISGAPAVVAALTFASIPATARTQARESLGAMAAGRAHALSVTVSTDDGWLVFEKRGSRAVRATPFAMRVPLASVAEVTASKPSLGLLGSSLVFTLSSGDRIVCDVMARKSKASLLASRFRDAARSASGHVGVHTAQIQVQTGAIPVRTPLPAARLMTMACFAPFAIAMIGAEDGGFAVAASTCLFILALTLQTFRPVAMARLISTGALVTAAAFVLDAIHTGEPLHLIGTGVCLALVAWANNNQQGHNSLIHPQRWSDALVSAACCFIVVTALSVGLRRTGLVVLGGALALVALIRFYRSHGGRPAAVLSGSVVIVVLTAALTQVNVGPRSDTSRSWSGSTTTIDMSLLAPSATPNRSNQAHCTTAEGFTDISSGMPVTVSDEAGAVLATGNLGPSFPVEHDQCAFDFSVTVPTGKTSYRFSTDNHGSIDYSATDLQARQNRVGMVVS